MRFFCASPKSLAGDAFQRALYMESITLPQRGNFAPHFFQSHIAQFVLAHDAPDGANVNCHCKRVPKHCKYADFHVKCGQEKAVWAIMVRGEETAMNGCRMDSGLYSFSHSLSQVASPGYMIHAHPFYELYYFVRGEVDYLLSGVERQLRPGAMLVILPGEFHGVRVNSAAVYERWTLHFDPEMLSAERREWLLEAAADAPALRFLEDAGEWGMEEAFAMYDGLSEVEESLRRKLVPVFTEAMLGRMMIRRRSLPRPQLAGATHAHVVTRVAGYLNEHFTERITLDSLAEKYYISKSHLNLTFRRAMGVTVMDYLTRRRVAYARQLLISGLPATQTAAAAGFGDYTSFYRNYVRHFGHAPNRDYSRLTPEQKLLRQEMTDMRPMTGNADGAQEADSLWERMPATRPGGDGAAMGKERNSI